MAQQEKFLHEENSTALEWINFGDDDDFWRIFFLSWRKSLLKFVDNTCSEVTEVDDALGSSWSLQRSIAASTSMAVPSVAGGLSAALVKDTGLA